MPVRPAEEPRRRFTLFHAALLLVRAGARRDAFSRRGRIFATALPLLSFAGFVVVALCQVGGAAGPSNAHNIASWVALGSFWVGMIATPWMRGVSRGLRWFAIAASAVVFLLWLPNGLHFMGIAEKSPVSMLGMELVVFPLCFVWFCWVAREWS